MAKRGRKNRYETHIIPFFQQIEEWLANGATERQIAEKLGIGYSTFNGYKANYVEFAELLKKGRRNLVSDLRGALVKKALGFNYTETKIVKEHIDISNDMKNVLLANGFTQEQIEQANLVKTEVTNKYATPDVAALNLALKNYDKDDWANDPQMLDLRKKELELRERQIESNEW